MNNIEVFGRVKDDLKQVAKNVAEQVLVLMNYPDKLDVAIEFVSEKEIQRLNNDYRNIDKVTDVLSFPSFSIEAGKILDVDSDEVKILLKSNDFIHFGDMAICLKQTERQAKEYGVSVKSEIKKLVIHSMLHLMGYDHIKDEDYIFMHKQEETLDKIILI